MVSNDDDDRDRAREVGRRRFVQLAAAGGSLAGIAEGSLAQDEETTEDPADLPDSRLASPRDFSGENYEHLYTYRRRRALDALLSDPEVNDAVESMISSFEAYDPHTARLDSISVQGARDLEIEGGIDEGSFEVTVVDWQVAYGLVDRETDDLVALTITEPQEVTWSIASDEAFDETRLQRVLEDPQVLEYVDDNDWYPSFGLPESIASAGGIEHGGTIPVVLFVAENDAISAVVATLDLRDDDVGTVIDVARVERFVEFPPHVLATGIEPADDTVLEAVPAVPFERRPWETADDGRHRIEEPEQSFERAEWTIEWEPPGYHGVEIAASYRDIPVFAALEAPVTYTGYGLPERDAESTLESFFPDDDPVFDGELLLWDVHSTEFGGPGALGVIGYPEASDRPEGFRFRTHYHTGAVDPEQRDHHAGYRFGQSNHDLSYDFWADGTCTPIWRRQGPGFVTEYASRAAADGETATGNHRSVSAFAMEITPGTDSGTEVQRFDGDEWTTLEEEFYQIGDAETIVRFTNPDGPETVELPLDDGTEVVVVRRGAREIPVQPRLEDPAVESGFYHPAQYVGNEPILDERVVVWVLLEAATGEVPHPAGSTSVVTRTPIRLSGY